MICLLSSLLLPALAADDAPLLVRLDGSGKTVVGPVVVRFATEGGATEVELNDNGRPPDAIAADGIWTGSGAVGGASAEVSVQATGWAGQAAEAMALPSGERRELDLMISGDAVALAPAERAAANAAPARAQSGPKSAEQLNTNRSGRRRTQGAPEGSNQDLWYVAAAVGAVALLGVGVFWFRHPRRLPAPPAGVERITEAGLFGPGTPALGAGLSQWVVAEGDRAALTAHLAQQVAVTRPLLVHAPADRELPPLRGGPGYRAAQAKAAEFQDAAYDLQEAHPNLVILLEAPAALEEWTRDLVGDFPVLAVVNAAQPGLGPVLRCARADAGWEIRGEST